MMQISSTMSLQLLQILGLLLSLCQGQMLPSSGMGPSPSLQVKITALPVPVNTAQHLPVITFTVIGRAPTERVFCVSEAPVSQLRFVCVDCVQRNITDMLEFLNAAQDLTHVTTFPTVTLPSMEANPAWNGATIMCQAAVNGGTKDSPVSQVDVRYLRSVHVVDSNGQGPALIPNQGFHFFVECIRGPDGVCQQSARRKTLHCAVQANPPPNQFRWLKNGQVVSGNGAEITIGTDMIGASLACAANNGLYGDEGFRSEAVSIDPYTAARLVQDNFQQAQISAPFQQGNRVNMDQRVQLSCIVEGYPRPLVFWKLRRPNGQVIDAPCPQGLNGQYREMPVVIGNGPASSQALQAANLIRLQALCDLQVSNYSFSGQYWCSACSQVSQGFPECAPGLDQPGERVLNMQVQGPPQQSDTEPSVEQHEDSNSATVLVHFCAEPGPRPPREMVFTIDGNDIQIGQTWQNFAFDNFVQNNTVPNCFVARLRIQPVLEDDQSRQISLKVQNQFGSKQIPVSLSELLGTNSSDLGGIPSWAVWLFIAALGIIFCCAIIYCMRMNLLCFEKMKSGGPQYSSDNLKAGVHDTYTDGPDGRQQFFATNGNGSMHGNENPYEAAVHAAFSESRISSV